MNRRTWAKAQRNHSPPGSAEAQSDEIQRRKSTREKRQVQRYGNPVTSFIYVNYINANVPVMYEEAVSSSDSENWKLAMDA